MAHDDDPNKWLQLKTYFTGWFGALITYPILFFTLGFLITFVF